MLPDPRQRVAGEPSVHLVLVAVPGGVVGVGVGLDAVGERLDQRRPAAFRGLGHRALHGRVDGGGVVAVDQHGGNPVADSLVGQRGGGALLGQRDADRVAVVLHEEHHRGLPDRREVQRGVGITLAGRAVTEHDQGDRVLALEPGRVGHADGVQRIGGQRGALGGDAVFVGVISAVPVPPQQRERLNGIYAPADHGHRVAVGREQPVPRAEREYRANLARFLAAG